MMFLNNSNIFFVVEQNQNNYILFSILLVLLSFNCQANVPIVICPATFSDGYDVYLFKNARVFDRPIELNADLKPEFEKDKQF